MRFLKKLRSGWLLQVDLLDLRRPNWKGKKHLFKWYGPVLLVHPNTMMGRCRRGCCSWVEERK
jgi:hypothetical protein